MFGKQYLRSTYLNPLRREKVIGESQPTMPNVDEKQSEATTILRQWCTALTKEKRNKCYKQAISYLTGQSSVEDTEAAVLAKFPKAKIAHTYATDVDNRDYLRFFQLYLEHQHQVEYINVAWQDFEPEKVQLSIEDCEHKGIVPYYERKYQPTTSEIDTLRRLLDMVSKTYTVFLIFGRPDMLYKYWVPVFENNVAKSKVSYRVESSLFHVVRSAARDSFTYNYAAWHSMCEDVLTVIRMPEISKSKKDKPQEEQRKHQIFRYCTEFAHKWGANGKPSNVYLNYEPPSARMQIRDVYGKPLRSNAEKTPMLNEYFLDLFVPPRGVIWDMCAGSGSMAIACIKNSMYYVGTDPDEDCAKAAMQRLGRTWAAHERKLMCETIAGIPRSLAEQVHDMESVYWKGRRKKSKTKQRKKGDGSGGILHIS